ncbi:NAD-dependent malic enzyme [bioreactor metagenome]|uniref:NAD-dependent malic enzyme n=1 Tax=bioreactor metagenome TaxID=1076179 RepID=A0A645AH63_9ZZZZ
MSLREDALELHRKHRGKLEVQSKVPVENIAQLSLAYTPGVAEPCKEIAIDKELVYHYTNKGNLVAVITDGTAVLGLGDIGPEAGLPVMEGKCVLFKRFAGIDAVPILLHSKDVDEIVQTVKIIAPSFGGINLEDISSPRCFEIERRLKECLDIPVFHDDQHGTAVVVLSAVINALRFVHKPLSECTVVVNGAGAAGTAVSNLILKAGAKNLLMVDRHGILIPGHEKNNVSQEKMAQITNKEKKTGDLREALKGADVFIGVSAGNIADRTMIANMNSDAIVFAMANPTPEIFPDEAKAGGARVVGTGRSDFANQVNNSLCFPGIFRGALDANATQINEEMKLAAAFALANLIEERDLREDYIIVGPFDPRICGAIATAVADAARLSGVVRKTAQ